MTFFGKTAILLPFIGLCAIALLGCTEDRPNRRAEAGALQNQGNAVGAIAYVGPENGLNLRERPNSTATRITALPQHTRLRVLARSSQTETIGDIESHWYMVDDGTDRGWVFGAHLVSQAPAELVPNMPVANAPRIVSDFTTNRASTEQSPMTQAGDFVVRGDVLVAYIGHQPHVQIPPDLGITKIDTHAFAHSHHVVSIRIPREILQIGNSEWAGMFPNTFGLESIIVDPDNEHYASLDGVLFDRDMTEILHIPRAKATPFAIPEGITSIRRNDFSGRSRIPSVSIPASVTGIEANAFSGCSGLESITVDPDNRSLASLDGVLFNRSMTVMLHFPHARPGPYTIPASVRSIAAESFQWRTNLTSVVIPEGITGIGNNAFRGTTSLVSVTIPSSVISIGNNAFMGATSLTSIVIPEGVTSIGNNAFAGATSLASVTIPSSMTGIGNAVFVETTNLTSIVIPDSVTWIGINAFAGSGLVSVTIPASVTSIGNNAFGNTASLASIIVDSGNRHFVSEGGVLFNSNMSQIVHFPHARAGSFTVPAGVTEIGSQFNSRTGLSSINIPATVTRISGGAFSGTTGLTAINVGDGNEHFVSVDGVLFNGDKTVLLRFPQGRQGAYSIPDTVTEIADTAFMGASGLTSVDIPNGVTSIGIRAFSGTSGLTEVYIPNSVTSIEWRAFERSGLISVTVPDSVTHLGTAAFADNPNLVSIVLPDGLRYFAYDNGKGGGEEVLIGSANLQRILVGSNNRYYSSVDGVLFSRDGRTLVRFPPGRQGHFSIPDTVTGIGYKAFYNATGLVSVCIPPSVTGIGDFAFDGTSLIDVTIPNGVRSIGSYAFARNPGLISFSIPASVTSIGEFAFFNSVNLRHFSVDRDNENFTLSNGVIFNRGMTEIAQILPTGTRQRYFLVQSE